MVTHPNRSRHTPTRFIAYSLASMNALAEGDCAKSAIMRETAANEINDEFIVVAAVRSKDPLWFLDALPQNAEIVWRGSNELAQRFRTA